MSAMRRQIPKPYRTEIMKGRQAIRSLLPSPLILILAFAGGPYTPARTQVQVQAQATCGETSSSTILVKDTSGVADLNASVNCNNGGDVTALWVGGVTLDGPISIGEGTFLSITGEDEFAEAHGDSQTRLFDVQPDGGLSLATLKLSRGRAANGGAILADTATITLNSCIFYGNTAEDGNGGAVWVNGGELMITGGNFSGNTASEFGGAVYALDATLVIQEETLFESNKAVEGGAVYCGGQELALDDAARVASCSLIAAEFVANNASRENALDYTDFEEPWIDLHGGGAAAFWYAEANITNAIFDGSFAQLAGGAVYGGNDTYLTVDGCIFKHNNATGYGGGIAASSMTVSGNTELSNNSAGNSGGGIFLWDPDGDTNLDEMVCVDNIVEKFGGCILASGTVNASDGVAMRGNFGDRGGCLYASGRSNVIISGGEYSCECTGNGGFAFVSDGGILNVTDGTFANNVAARRGGAIYCSGNSFGMGGSVVTIEGGTFANNTALELGGALVAWGSTTVVTVEGGTFRNNSGKFYGGFIFLEEKASLTCEGATILENYASDQGGGIYARDATWVNSSCDLIGNEATQGAAAYLTNVVRSAYFEDLAIKYSIASGGSVVYVAESSVVATRVTFESGAGLLDDSSNRAVQLDSGSTLVGDKCVFTGWLGDTVIYNSNANNGSLVLNSCDFRGSSATMAVSSPQSDAEIRNAIIDEDMLTNAVIQDGSAVLVDRALDCDSPNACWGDECFDSTLGVLCECLEDGACLDDGGMLSLSLKTPPETITYSPDAVSFELLVEADTTGTTDATWYLTFEAEELDLQLLPSSGVLPLGGNITVTVTGYPLQADIGGNLTSHFVVASVGGNASSSSTGVELDVLSAFYLCAAFEFAVPLNYTDHTIECEQCASIDNEDGVNCELPGATLASLPIKEGYWRSSNQSVVIHSCIYSKACAGTSSISTADDYCSTAYRGPLCAVCAEGYGSGVGLTCHTCDGTTARVQIAAGILFCVIICVLLILALVFLIGGLDAVRSVGQPMSSKLSMDSNPFKLALSRSGTDTVEATSGKGIPAFTAVEVCETRGGAWDLPSVRSYENLAGLDPRLSDARSKGIHERKYPMAVGAITGEAKIEDRDNIDATDSDSGKSRCWGCEDRVRRFRKRIPWDKVKILIVVWQILTVLPSITGVEFPPVYSRFLSWIDIVNLDLGRIFSASCIIPRVDFYHRLLAATLTPIALGAVLAVTYQMAKRRSGIGSAGVIARRAVKSRHMAAGLLLTFLVFTSTSTTVFKTFACDESVVEGKSFLRADYSISCNSKMHYFYVVYSSIMLVVYPIGIPLVYALILWKHRHSLNPVACPSILPSRAGQDTPEVLNECDEEPFPGRFWRKFGKWKEGRVVKALSSEETAELEERINKRINDPDLVPSMFLWKDFGPDLYYYEVIECGRRILLTGLLIFIAPESSAQVAMACIFAFMSLLGFEILHPHLDPVDAWLYRMGCVVIFLSNFLALLVKVDAAGEGRRETLGGIMVALNVLLVVAVLFTSWMATQQSVQEFRENEGALAMTRTMLTSERTAPSHQCMARSGNQEASTLLHAYRPKEAPRRPTASSVTVSEARAGTNIAPVSISMVEELWRRDQMLGSDAGQSGQALNPIKREEEPDMI